MTTSIVYVVERNGKPRQDNAGVTALPNPKAVEVWEAIRPLPQIQVDKVVPYISVSDLESVTSLEDLKRVITTAKNSLPKISEADLKIRKKNTYNIPKNLTKGKIVVHYYGSTLWGWVKNGHVKWDIISGWKHPMLKYTKDPVPVKEFLRIMREANAVYRLKGNYYLY